MGALGLGVCARASGQEPPQPRNSLPESTKTTGSETVRVCLRLDDGMPFLGEANLRLKASEGATVAPVSENMGNYQFTGVAPGHYVVEVSAAGFLGQQLSTDVTAGNGQRALFVVMVRRTDEANPAEATEEKTRTTGSAVASADRRSEKEAPSPLPPTEGRDYWRDHELEKVVPPVETGVACPAERVLAGTAHQMSEFVDTMEKFTATEEVVHYAMRKSGEPAQPQKRQFTYVATVTKNRDGIFVVDEFRNGSDATQLFPGNLATRGLPALALIFHPLMARDFDFQCEGMGQRGGRQTWQVHFAQRHDRPMQIREYNINGRIRAVALEGRAWIDPGSFQVVRLETELESPVPEIRLTKEHTVLEYAPVRFAQSGQEVWLPQRAELYVERNEKRYYRMHIFSDFRLFNVETAQTVQAPRGSYSFTNLTDQDVKGELTVMSSVGGAEGRVIKLKFTVPARGRVIKTVGPGKDVDAAEASVVAAQFVYAGEDWAVRVDANLGRESTIDVVVEK